MDLTLTATSSRTGTEQTNAAGYYRGAVYHGANPDARRADRAAHDRKWVGFGKGRRSHRAGGS